MAKHLKLHPFTGASDHDFTGLVTGETIYFNGTNIVSSGVGISGQTLSQVITNGNTTEGTNISLTNTDRIEFGSTGRWVGFDDNISDYVVFQSEDDGFLIGGQGASGTDGGYGLEISSQGEVRLISQTSNLGVTWNNSSWTGVNPTLRIEPLDQTSNNTQTFQDASGTIALLSDVTGVTSGNLWSASTGTNSIIANNGTGNIASGNYAFVAGRSNTGSGNQSTVGGGQSNTASNGYATVGGGYNNLASGFYSVIAGGVANSATGTTGTVGGGQSNQAAGGYSTIGGGSSSIADGGFSFIGGGQSNRARGVKSVVGGGQDNEARALYTTIAGGLNNSTAVYGTTYASIGGGRNNYAAGYWSTVGGGNQNRTFGYGVTIAGGHSNTGTTNYSTVGGGRDNVASATHSTIVGGQGNRASGQYSIAGGNSSTASGNYASISLGYRNLSSYAGTATVGGGYNTASTGYYAGVFAGGANLASSYGATVVGGSGHRATGDRSAIMGGTGNLTSGIRNAAIGGQNNSATTAFNVVVIGGTQNHSSGLNSVIAGGNSLNNTFDNTFMTQNARLAENGGVIYSAGTDLYSIFTTSAGVTGSGTNNTIPIWNGTTTLTDSIMTYDGNSGITVAGDVFIEGSVEVLGSATTIVTQDLFVEDNTITLNSGGTATSATGGGIFIEDGVVEGVDASWTIDSNGNWQTDNGITSSAMTVSNGNLNVTGSGAIQSGGTDLYDIFTQDLQSVLNEGSTGTVDTDIALIKDFTGSTAEGRMRLLQLGSDEAAVLQVQDGLSATTFQAVLNNNIQMSFSQGFSSAQRISFNGNAMTVLDTANDQGLVYAGNYHPAYTDRSLVDKEYVDSVVSTGVTTVTASNGLTKTADNITLGGALTADTTISGTKEMKFDGLTGFTVDNINGDINLGANNEINMFVGSGSGDLNIQNSGSGNSNILAGSGAVSLTTDNSNLDVDGSGSINMSLQAQSTITDQRSAGSTAGIEYADNYHAGYADRTLVDKGYVDNVIATGVTTSTASNGLTKTGNNITLGGTLTADTTISAEFQMNWNGLSQFSATTADGAEMSITADEAYIVAPGGLSVNANSYVNANFSGDTIHAVDFFSMVPYTGANPSSPANNDIWFHSGATGTITLNYQVGGSTFSVELSS